MPSADPSAGPVIIGGFVGAAADDVHLLVFVVLMAAGLALFALGVAAMGVWRRG